MPNLTDVADVICHVDAQISMSTQFLYPKFLYPKFLYPKF